MTSPDLTDANVDKLAELFPSVVTETLDVVPRRWFVRQTVRETFTCRDCEAISEPPAPFHVVPRGRFGAGLLAMVLFEKYGCHQPLNRQSERYAREGVNLDVSTLADQVGTAAAVLAPLHALLRYHVLAAGRLHEIKSCDILQPGPAALTDGLEQLHRLLADWAAASGAGPTS